MIKIFNDDLYMRGRDYQIGYELVVILSALIRKNKFLLNNLFKISTPEMKNFLTALQIACHKAKEVTIKNKRK